MTGWYAGLRGGTPRRNSHAYGLLHAICATAVRGNLIDRNPCQVARAMNTPARRKPVILTIDELAAVTGGIVPERLRALVLISAWCGLRWGEVIELRHKDIGAGCETVSVSRAVTHRAGCKIDTPKSGEGRTVVTPAHIRADIKTHLNEHVAQDPSALLFPAQKYGCHLNDSVFMRSAFKPALKTVGREDVRIHDLRHFAASMTARVGNLPETMNRLGHSTARASLIYQQAMSGRDAEIAAALSALAAANTSAAKGKG